MLSATQMFHLFMFMPCLQIMQCIRKECQAFQSPDIKLMTRCISHQVEIWIVDCITNGHNRRGNKTNRTGNSNKIDTEWTNHEPICSTAEEKCSQQESCDRKKPNLFHWISVRAMTATNSCITKRYITRGDLQDWTLQNHAKFLYFESAGMTTLKSAEEIWTTEMQHLKTYKIIKFILLHQSNELHPPGICCLPFRTHNGPNNKKGHL